jgi:hypothetical protein
LTQALEPLPTAATVRFEFRSGREPAVISSGGYRAAILPFKPRDESRWDRYANAAPAPIEPRVPAKQPTEAEPEPEPDKPADPTRPARKRAPRPLAPETPARPITPESPAGKPIPV